ncbi:RES domain-containing protein [Acidocella aminolytica 101 = DSM 11237]|uniref:RES family NAD+ phosphorylase n=2 Tax=Acidocella aminolytica TaxID=33998 RepID=UPI000921B6E5|nr:RES family NAD+ phosphorylase [Acidocella aminolytica]GBQ34705.1 RES domain-containing protein [Acidocella aminolytica 101 = DSM 11237]SHF10520.1 RES domain-containing protein [Acidocella aminolytica 101 = DSM 11237]
MLIAAEQKTNPRLMETIGTFDLVPVTRRVSGPGASYLMAPFTHVYPERPSRFGAGTYGVLYAARTYETALLETIHHHARFMAQTGQPPGWTSQFRVLVRDILASLHDLWGGIDAFASTLDPNCNTAAQQLAAALRDSGSHGLVYPSRRAPAGVCVGLFYPDLASPPVQWRHLDYHWDGVRADLVRDDGTGEVFRLKEW